MIASPKRTCCIAWGVRARKHAPQAPFFTSATATPSRAPARRSYRESTGAGGTGLGLAIVRRVAERHGGSVALEDAAGGRGLKVRVTLPAA